MTDSDVIDIEPTDTAENPESPALEGVSTAVGEWWRAEGVQAPVITNFSPTTREFWGADYADPSPLEPGVWLVPAQAILGEAPSAPAGHVMVLAADGAAWEAVEDHRGKNVFSTATKAGETWEMLGALPEGYTLTAPASDYDEWDGEEWVEDEASRLAALKANAVKKKTLLNQLATSNTTRLGFAVELGIASDQEVADLKAWKTYMVLLGRVDLSTSLPAATDWPEAPVGDDVDAWLAAQGFEEVAPTPAAVADADSAPATEPAPDADTPAEQS